jgi:hypothetical protein
MILDTIWMIVMPDNRGIVYNTISTRPSDCWRLLEEGQLMGTAMDRKRLRAQGYRVKRVQVVIPETDKL